MGHGDRRDSGRGVVTSGRGFDRLHMLAAPHGMIVACGDRGERAHGPPAFRKMHGRTPPGGGRAAPGAAYHQTEPRYDRGRRQDAAGDMPQARLRAKRIKPGGRHAGAARGRSGVPRGAAGAARRGMPSRSPRTGSARSPAQEPLPCGGCGRSPGYATTPYPRRRASSYRLCDTPGWGCRQTRQIFTNRPHTSPPPPDHGSLGGLPASFVMKWHTKGGQNPSHWTALRADLN